MSPLLQFLLFWVAPTLLAYKIGRSKQRPAGFCWGLLLSWLGVLILATLPDKVSRAERQVARAHFQPGHYAAADGDDDLYDGFENVPPAPAPAGPSTCPTCRGRKMVLCPQCEGKRTIKLMRQPQGSEWIAHSYDAPCPTCGASGKVPCGTCHGSGGVY